MRALIVAAGVAGLAATWSPAAPAADAYPNHVIRIIQPLGPGSPGDILSRAIADGLSKSLGQPVIVENRVGANGLIGMTDCTRAAPDGYTLCAPSFSQMSVNPFLYAKMPYDTMRDLAPVALIGAITSCITVNAEVPAHSLQELIELAKQKPGTLNWGSWGIGSFSHLTLAWLQSTTGTSFTHVPYKTLGQAVSGMVAGEVQVMVNTPAVAKPFVDTGKVRVLTILGRERSPLLDVPTIKELGYDLPVLSWVGVTAPAATPKPIIARLNAEIAKLVADPQFVARFMTPSSLTPLGGTAEEFATFIASEHAAMVKLAVEANIQKE
jgi:tripartite-type tricarboxylate transporter receptor subunit TctC